MMVIFVSLLSLSRHYFMMSITFKRKAEGSEILITTFLIKDTHPPNGNNDICEENDQVAELMTTQCLEKRNGRTFETRIKYANETKFCNKWQISQ